MTISDGVFEVTGQFSVFVMIFGVSHSQYEFFQSGGDLVSHMKQDSDHCPDLNNMSMSMNSALQPLYLSFI